MTKNTPSLNGLYTPFGKVTAGLDVVHAIENVEVQSRDQSSEGLDKPVNPPVITSLKVETFGIDYGMPQTLDVFDMNQWMNQYYGQSLQQ